MRIKQGLFILLVICIIATEVSAGKQKRSNGKGEKNSKEKNSKEEKYNKKDQKHGKYHEQSKQNEETVVEEEMSVEEEVAEEPVEESAQEPVKETKKNSKTEKVDSKKNQKSKKEKVLKEHKCDCPAGPAGPPGPPGEKGECIYQPIESCPTPTPSDFSEHVSSNQIFVINPGTNIAALHSQTTEIPKCQIGQRTLWEGYSLLRTDSNSQSTKFDLASPSSCMQKFTAGLTTACGIDGQCMEAQRNDRSYWLLANQSITQEAIPEADASNFVSRCVVCDNMPSTVLAIHSQSDTIPKCPIGYTELRNGYSYLMHTVLGKGGSGQGLASIGSCLREFRKPLFMECNPNKKSCDIQETHVAMWLNIQQKPVLHEGIHTMVHEGIKESIDEMFHTVSSEPKDSISRCVICVQG